MPARVGTLSTAPDRIAFDVEVPALELRAVEGEDGLMTPLLEDYGPMLTVAIPPDGDVQLRAVGFDAQVRDGVLLAPVPMVSRDGQGASESYLRDPAAYAAARVGTGVRAHLLQTAWIRNQRVVQISIEPADYEPASKRLTLWRRIHVELSVAPARPGPPAERNDPFEGVYRSVLVNYQQGQGWRGPAGRVVPARERRAGIAAAAAAQTVPDTSVFVGRDWVKILVSRPGLYKLDYQKVRSFPPFQSTNTPWANVRLFTWPGYPVLPEESYCDSCDYKEVPFGISDEGGDNAFHTNNDYLYFYALGPQDWANAYDPTWPDTSYINHPYETSNVYYLTASTAAKPIPGAPKRIQFTTVDADTTLPALQWTSVPVRLHLESENEYYPNSPPLDGGTNYGLGTLDGLVWQKWFWITVGAGDIRSTTFDLPGLDPSQPARMHIRLWGLTFPPKGFTVTNRAIVTLQGTASTTLPQVTWIRKTSVTLDTLVTGLQEIGNSLVLNSPAGGDPSSRVGLGFIEARYQRKLVPVNDTLSFEVPATGQRTLLRVGPFQSAVSPMLFDVTDANAPVQVSGASFDAVSKLLVFAVDGSRPRRFFALPSFGFAPFPLGSVIAASSISQVNLRRMGADYLVIYYDEFAAAAESLAAWRAVHLPLSGVPPPYVTRTLPISAIYDQFSGGRADPLAIRNFLRAAFYAGDTVGTGASGGRRLSYVTFLGDASYDFKNIYRKAGPGQPGCLLPTYENGYDGGVEGGRKFTTDDWLANVDDASVALPDIFTGRIPVSDAASALDVVRNKVLFYERSAPLGEDRNRVLLIADDNTQCDAFDAVGWGHVLHTALIDSLAIPKHIDRDYVYLHKFPRASAQSCLKPLARAAIQDAINQGVLLMNFVGHGSPFQLADEQVMIQSDVGTLVNGPRYPVMCTSSACCCRPAGARWA